MRFFTNAHRRDLGLTFVKMLSDAHIFTIAPFSSHMIVNLPGAGMGGYLMIEREVLDYCQGLALASLSAWFRKQEWGLQTGLESSDVQAA